MMNGMNVYLKVVLKRSIMFCSILLLFVVLLVTSNEVLFGLRTCFFYSNHLPHLCNMKNSEMINVQNCVKMETKIKVENSRRRKNKKDRKEASETESNPGAESKVQEIFNNPPNIDGFYYVEAVKKETLPKTNYFEATNEIKIEDLSNPLSLKDYEVKPFDKIRLSPLDKGFDTDIEVVDNFVTSFTGTGYAMARATHGVNIGKYYFETRFVHVGSDGCARIGFSQLFAPINGPCGFDKFSYGVRSKDGSIFHNSFNKGCSGVSFCVGDVLGCLIELSQQNDTLINEEKMLLLKNNGYKTSLINYNKKLYFEHFYDYDKTLGRMKATEGNRISFFKNGEKIKCEFDSVNGGFYYPAVSLYGDIKVGVSFGGAGEYVFGVVPLEELQTPTSRMHFN